MANQSVSRTGTEVKESWVPMITIALAQILMSFTWPPYLLRWAGW